MIEFYHAPMSRSIGVLYLLEELGIEYQTKIVDITGGPAPESYRAIQAHKKVPAIAHDGVVVTERAAICAYLSDVFPEKGLAPRIGDPARAAYLTWLVYHDSVFDPALSAKILGWQYEGRGVAFGSFDDVIANLDRQLSAHPYIAGDAFTAADTQFAPSFGWAMHSFDQFPKKKSFTDYLSRVSERPAYKRAFSKTFG